ncbi:type I methionyl aminopeptidase [Candidatus Kaiserbacteria bacterium RIFCSPLOWO2_12_FULL_50_28]|uniref:Methionine aminopeptidase n=2 Tax=Candidatus Kaiseribacteriota TaxID=1752734 RepID=A0A1F6FQ32_9BACT|nr:MAG: type I methionyl aminopeptidase [Candidatus Kaiserbacteria bacterium RIFCSPLOWO2_12_FULL_50_28]
MIARTPEEIQLLREGGRRLAQHVRVLCEMVKPGVASADIETKAREMVAHDGDEMAFFGYKGKKGEQGFPSGVCVSVNDVIVHSPAGQNGSVFGEGDVVCIDFGIKHKGFFTDHAQTVIVGEGSPEDKRLVSGTYEALEAGIAQARVGSTTGDIGYAVERVAQKYGFGFPRNLAGHGVGRAIHEEPHVPNFGVPGSGAKLAEGLVIAIEPMMTLGSGELFIDKDGHSYRTKDGSRTAHAEHTVLITKKGPEILTKE